MSHRNNGLEHLARTFWEVARARARHEAARAAWPLPGALRVHLWLYAQGIAAPTQVDPPEATA